MKKTARKSLKKYLTGTSVKDYIQDPNTELYQNQINVAKAKHKAESNPFLNILQGIGVAGVGAGMDMAGVGQFSDLGKQLATTEFAMGGTTKSIPVEIEGEEVIETPDGKVAKANGPDHENGGIPISLPEGTEVFSKRIQKMGESMAERKMAREKKVSKLEKALASNPNDTLTKKTLNRVKENNEKEEEADMQLQEAITNMFNPNNEMGCGGKVKKMPGGGIILDDNVQTKANWGYENPLSYKGEKTPQAQNLEMTTSQEFMPDITNTPLSSSSTSGTQSSKLGNLLNSLGTNPPTAGDALGLAGTAVSTFAPYLNTLKNRAGDTPNINYFENYGEEGLATLDKSKQYIGQERDKALQDLQLSKQAQMRKTRSNSRGVNTMRAFDLAAEQAANKASGDIYSSYANQMMQTLGMEAQMQDKQDQVVMGGQREKDLADRADRDNYFTQRGASMSNIGTGMQAGAKSLNQMKGRGDNQKMIQSLIDSGIDINTLSSALQEFLKSQG